MGKVVEAELLLKGKDQTGAAFAGVIKHAEELQAKLRGINYGTGNAALAEQANLLRKNSSLLRAERMAAQEVNFVYRAGNAALAERATLFGRMRQHMQGMAQVSGMGWMMGGIASGRLAHSVARASGDYAHQSAKLGAGGMTPAEVAKAERAALGLRVPLMSAADNLKAIGELRMVFGSTDHAIEHVGMLQRAAATMKAINPHMDAENESYNLARALELKGVSNDPAHFNKLTSMMVQAINASHGKVTGSEFFEFTKYARGGAGRLTDEFYTRVAPTLIQELGGHNAGVALRSFRQTLIGGKMTNKAADEFVKLGLVDAKKVIWTKSGHVKGVRPGGLVDSALANEDPYAWIQGYLKPALAKAKITDPNKIAEVLAHLFGNSNAEQMASLLLNQWQRIEKDWGLIAGAPSTEYLEKILDSDPQAASANLSKAIDTMLAVFGGPMVGPAIKSMNVVSGWARSFADEYAKFAKENPALARGTSGAAAAGLGYAGWKGFQATWGMLSGSTALKGSAAALTESAAALNGAAARLGLAAGGPISQFPPGPKNSSRVRVGGELLKGAGIIGTLLTADEIAYNNLSPETKARIKAKEDRINSISPVFKRSKTDILRGSFNHDRLELGLPETLAGREKTGGIGSDYASAMHGSADVHVSVSAGDGLRAEIVSIVNNALHGLHINGTLSSGTSGSTGGSMPEARPGAL